MANEIGGQRLALALGMAEMQELDRAEKLIVDVLLNVADCTEAITKNLGSMDPAMDESVHVNTVCGLVSISTSISTGSRKSYSFRHMCSIGTLRSWR